MEYLYRLKNERNLNELSFHERIQSIRDLNDILIHDLSLKKDIITIDEYRKRNHNYKEELSEIVKLRLPKKPKIKHQRKVSYRNKIFLQFLNEILEEAECEY